jgi:integrase/recombinase XerC
MLHAVQPQAPDTIPALTPAFLADLEHGEAAPKTIASYGFDLADFCAWYATELGEPATPENVTPTDVRAYRGHLLHTARRAPKTVNRRLAALKRFFRWAQAEGLVAELPTDGVKLIHEAPRSPGWLPRREIARLLRAVEAGGSVRDRAVIMTLRHTGLRVGELEQLAVEDVVATERKGAVVVRSGKGAKYRVVPLNADARAALRAYLAVRPLSRDRRLFGLGARAIEKLIARYARAAGLEDVTPHTLRHSFGKHALEAGVDLVSVAALLGHEKLETTARYTTPSQRDLERAVGQLELDADLPRR